jgi:heavy metal sensor kinase
MSIRTRLTIFYTALLALILLLFSAGVYGAVSFIMRGQVDDNLKRASDTLINSLLISASGRDVVVPQLNVIGLVIDTEGTIINRSNNIDKAVTKPFAGVDFAKLNAEPAEQLQETYYSNITHNGMNMRVLTRPIVGEKLPRRVFFYLQVASPLEEVQLAERGLLLALLWGTGIGILISAVGGAFMAWRALRPVDKITQTARDILSTDNLDQRVPISSKPNDEVGRLAHAFNDMLERLSKLFRVQQRLVADVSHELRTPLTVLRGNVDLLRAMGCADMESLDAMTREADRMTRMVGNILLLSQADSGVLPMQMQVMEMAPLIQDVVRSANVLAGERVQIESNICTDALVKGDHDRLKQVFLNLVENAIKHTPTGGQVSIDCNSDDPALKTTALQATKQIHIAVSDTGIGIPESDLPHVFERFYRVDKSRSREHGGAGLGLSIALSIVQTHGGHMSVRSKMGEGTTFEVHLPAYQPSLTAV